MLKSINVFGEKLKTCCENPKTGFFRDGCCNTSKQDYGMHTVCILATEDFLTFSKSVGNDLSTPNPTFNFKGLKPGDKWCLCALRWKQALENNVAPPVFLDSTHYRTLEVLDLSDLQKYAFN
ncbi:MAG: hypothetical protein CMG24_01815 [Candidatus Marinimicrobia bacterium]|nr:hypothetical protein [Candidatus Neomarinimicrobiota bacterium]|tara:strand:+ start:327 stop:692 length:366 start_codon:yes stop_codon:yes gene_type:complete